MFDALQATIVGATGASGATGATGIVAATGEAAHSAGTNWEMWVAIGTIGLAFSTVTLAAITARLVFVGQRDVEAQWRPVLVMDEDKTKMATSYIDKQPFEMPDPSLTVYRYNETALNRKHETRMGFRVCNVGRGPALSVELKTSPFNLVADVGSMTPSGKWEFSIWRMNDELDAMSDFSIDLEYRGVSGTGYRSTISLTKRKNTWRVADVIVHDRIGLWRKLRARVRL